MIAAELSSIFAVVGLYVLQHNHSIGFGRPHTAAFVGVVLVAAAAALCAVNAVLTRASRRRVEAGVY